MTRRKTRISVNQGSMFSVPTRYAGQVGIAEREAAQKALRMMRVGMEHKKKLCPSCNQRNIMPLVVDYHVCPVCNTHCHHI